MQRIFLVYLEPTLYPSISLVEKRRDLKPVSRHKIPCMLGKCKKPPPPMPCNLQIVQEANAKYSKTLSENLPDCLGERKLDVVSIGLLAPH
jgi:hypothetical protein